MYEQRPGGYPWAGRRLAPAALRECLLVDVPPEIGANAPDPPQTLADLDARAWNWFTPSQCILLADAVVARVREVVPMLVRPGSLARRRVPFVAAGVSLGDLDLSVRAHNAFARSPIGSSPEQLATATFDDILSVRGLGAKGLVELLVALEEAGGSPQPDADADADAVAGVPADIRPEAQDPNAFSGGLSPADVSRLGAWCRGETESLPSSILRRRLPEIPGDTHVDDLGLLPRTSGALVRAGHAMVGGWLRSATIGDILRLPGLGRTSLGDLLAGIVRLMLLPPPREDLTELAQSIADVEIADSIAADDPRFGDTAVTLCRPGETLRSAAARIARRPRDPANLAEFSAHLSAVSRTLDRLGHQLLEDQLVELAVAVSDERSGAMFARYYGWDGLGGTVLQTVGDEYGITRERVRQLCGKAENRLRAVRPYAPVLVRALDQAVCVAPAWADDLAADLRDQHLTATALDPQVLIDAAELLGVEVSIRIETVAGRRRVARLDDDSGAELEQLTRLIRRESRRAVEHWGVGRLSHVVATVSKEHGEAVDPAQVESVVSLDDGFQWLDQPGGWFWNADIPRNRLTNQIDKVLCVAGSIHASELRVAVTRNYRMEGQAPPFAIFMELCRRLPNRHIEDDIVRAEPRLAPTSVLADTELHFFEILSSQGSVMSRPDLEEVCRQRGMNRATFYVYLGNSPILTCPRRGVYALIGTIPSDDQLDELARHRRRGRVLVASGRLNEDRLWILYCLSENMQRAGVFGVPTAMKQVLHGEFELWTGDGLAVGTISCGEYGGVGLSPFLRCEEAQSGQYLALVFDVVSHEAVATLGDDALAERFTSLGIDADDEDDDLPAEHVGSC